MPIWPLFKRDLWSRVKLGTPSLSFDHNSCILGPNEQCEGILNIYTLINFQWYLGESNWCLFSLSTKALNIWNSHTNATPKVGMDLGVIGLDLLHFPPFAKLCFSPKHTLWLHVPLHSTFSCKPDVKIVTQIELEHIFQHSQPCLEVCVLIPS
jgi:hypothetical protein